MPGAPSAPSAREALLRLGDYWLTVARRTWRATAVSSFLSPLFYVLAMGVVLGGFIEADPSELEGATTYLAFLAPGLVAGHAMQTAVGETTYPVFGMFKWNRVYDAMLATPLTPTEVVRAHLAYVVVRVLVACAVFDLVLAPFGVYGTWWGPCAALAAQVLTGTAFAVWTYGFSCRVHSDAAFGVLFRIGVFPLFLFSGAFFPVANLGDVGAAIARLTPLWHGVNLSRMFSIATGPGDPDWALAALNAVVLLALSALGWRWARTGLERRVAA